MANNDYNNMYNNFNSFSRYGRYLYIISFIIQWSILMMILNLVTLYRFSLIVFIIFVLDALTMIHRQKTLRRPSFILTYIWNFIDSFRDPQSKTHDILNTIESYIRKICYRFENIYANIKKSINNFRTNQKQEDKYSKERDFNKFSSEIGSKVIIESIKPDGKIEKKSFKYKDRALTYINMLNSNGYKDFTQFNVDVKLSPAYIVINKNKDLVDLENNKIKLPKSDNNYKFVTDGWPSL